MELRQHDTLVRAVVALAIAAGLAMIVASGPRLTTVGVLLVILGLMGLMPVVRMALAPPA